MGVFGNQNIQATTQPFSNYINVFRFQMNAENGTATSISVYVDVTTAAKLMKCALYNDTYNFIAETEEKTIAVGGPTWETFNFSSPPSLVASTWYRLGIWANAGTGGAINFYYAATGGAHRFSSNTYVSVGGWETPLTGTDTTRLTSIYCTYTVGGLSIPVAMRTYRNLRT